MESRGWTDNSGWVGCAVHFLEKCDADEGLGLLVDLEIPSLRVFLTGERASALTDGDTVYLPWPTLLYFGECHKVDRWMSEGESGIG